MQQKYKETDLSPFQFGNGNLISWKDHYIVAIHGIMSLALMFY